ncbi:MAG TPA: L,D-transpeptidase [Afipia sp.]|uniref:L,D-transpeptidase n=1 Tax=unclassified Afipia TaxID=2642050 RepID=UPI000467BD7F|nr:MULTISPECIES: L,D-transpeptidase [unclassified Afipia]MAH70808.1 L,D-transpeptidase [Afipia sp.]OUX60237.1 MAG: L,D-transpeptidase [Afipia sp. TMED4]HAO39076.1 L,D-transpeptidase [Afipia sp.]HAP45733.1 L,D-transpeptidase [Afipia sp.]HAQ94590.1 L,D-transpeptidase [Afipia sp.]
MTSPLAALRAAAHPCLRVLCTAGLTLLLAACNQAALQQASYAPPRHPQYPALADSTFKIPAVEAETIDPKYVKRRVRYATQHPPGTIVVDPYAKFLYLVQESGFAMRYGVGVGRDGFGWTGTADIRRKAQWPTWTPPSAMIARQPELKQYRQGMGAGIENPLGARALYLFQNGKDTLFRIHGTNEPESIGKNVSSGCIRLLNQDVIDLFDRVPVGSKVVVLSEQEARAASSIEANLLTKAEVLR